MRRARIDDASVLSYLRRQGLMDRQAGTAELCQRPPVRMVAEVAGRDASVMSSLRWLGLETSAVVQLAYEYAADYVAIVAVKGWRIRCKFAG